MAATKWVLYSRYQMGLYGCRKKLGPTSYGSIDRFLQVAATWASTAIIKPIYKLAQHLFCSLSIAKATKTVRPISSHSSFQVWIIRIYLDLSTLSMIPGMDFILLFDFLTYHLLFCGSNLLGILLGIFWILVFNLQLWNFLKQFSWKTNQEIHHFFVNLLMLFFFSWKTRWLFLRDFVFVFVFLCVFFFSFCSGFVPVRMWGKREISK